MTKFVLIHGAWLGAWAWSSTAPILWKEGHPAYAVTLTGMGERVHLASEKVGMETAVQDVLNFMKFNELEEAVLVGHSFAGKVAAAAADRSHGRVKKVVYLDAFRPERVRTPQGGFDPRGEFGAMPEGSLGVPLTRSIVEHIGPDVHGPQLQRLLALATPWPLKMATDPITLSSHYDSVKEAYIFCSLAGDPVEEIVAGQWGKLDGPHTVLDTGHWPMITKPAELARDLVSLVERL